MLGGVLAVLTPLRTGMGDETDIVVLEGLDGADIVVTGADRTVKKLEDGKAVNETTEKETEEETEVRTKDSESGSAE